MLPFRFANTINNATEYSILSAHPTPRRQDRSTLQVSGFCFNFAFVLSGAEASVLVAFTIRAVCACVLGCGCPKFDQTGN